MPKTYYLPPEDAANDLFEHFAVAIGKYAAAFGLSAKDLAAQAADAAYFRWTLTQTASARGYAEAFRSWRDIVLTGNGASGAATPVTPASNPPETVPPGILPRFQRLVAAIKNHAAYTEAIGADLHIEGAEKTAPDLANAQPDLTGTGVVSDAVRLPWKKGGYDGIRIEVDRGDGKGFTFLAVDTRPDYFDTEPFPATGATWKYRAIYLKDDEKVGQWSATVSVQVG